MTIDPFNLLIMGIGLLLGLFVVYFFIGFIDRNTSIKTIKPIKH